MGRSSSLSPVLETSPSLPIKRRSLKYFVKNDTSNGPPIPRRKSSAKLRNNTGASFTFPPSPDRETQTGELPSPVMGVYRSDSERSPRPSRNIQCKRLRPSENSSQNLVSGVFILGDHTNQSTGADFPQLSLLYQDERSSIETTSSNPDSQDSTEVSDFDLTPRQGHTAVAEDQNRAIQFQLGRELRRSSIKAINTKPSTPIMRFSGSLPPHCHDSQYHTSWRNSHARRLHTSSEENLLSSNDGNGSNGFQVLGNQTRPAKQNAASRILAGFGLQRASRNINGGSSKVAAPEESFTQMLGKLSLGSLSSSKSRHSRASSVNSVGYPYK
jgi:hypothetical protein